MADVDWSAAARFGRIHPEPGELTDAEKTEIEKLRARHDELVNMDEDQWTDELVEEAEAIEPRLDAMEAQVEARARFKPEDFAMAGCIATIGRDGSLQVIQGLVKPEDMPKPAEPDAIGADAQSAERGDSDGDSDGATDTGRIAGPAMSTPAQPPKDREAEARKEAGVGIGFAKHVRPNAELFWSRIKKSHILDIARATFGAASTSTPTSFRRSSGGSWLRMDAHVMHLTPMP